MRRTGGVLIVVGMIAAMFFSEAVPEAGAASSGSKFVSRIEKKQKSLMNKALNGRRLRRTAKKRRSAVRKK